MKAGGPTDEQIRARAYAIFQERGCQPGHEMDDWLQAEYELLELPIEQLARFDSLPLNKGGKRVSVAGLVQVALVLAAYVMRRLN